MVIDYIDIIPYEKKIFSQLRNSKHIYTSKKGFYVKLISGNYNGFGEVSILEGFSKESLKEVSWAFEVLRLGFPLKEKIDLDELLDYIYIQTENFSSLRFGVETAIYDIYCQIKKSSISSYFSKKNHNPIFLSTIYNNNNNRYQNFDTIKLKIGFNSLDEDIKIMRKINSYKKMKFRLDANQALSVDDIIKIEKATKDFDIEYLEEPLSDLTIENLRIIKKNTNFKIAIDETIYTDKNWKEFLSTGMINYLIIKPSIFGGFKDFFEIVNFANNNKVEIILSSSIETRIGHFACLHLASSLNSKTRHGLDYFAFYTDSENVFFNQNDCKIKLDKIIGLGAKL